VQCDFGKKREWPIWRRLDDGKANVLAQGRYAGLPA